MKNTFKAHCAPVLFTIALITVIGFTMVNCGNGSTSPLILPPLTEHVHQWGDWKVTTAATCIAKGEETRVCTLDPSHKETRETAIDPDAHDWELLEGTAPTCTTDGNGKEKCKLCGIEENGVLPKLGHNWGEWVQTKAPTDTQDGEQERTCKHDANHKEKEVVAALNHTHDWGAWQTITPATCTAKGEKKQVCTLNSAHEKIEDINALGHDYQWQATTPATLTSEGVETEICTHDSTHTRGTRISDPLPITTAEQWNAAIAEISGEGNDKTYDINVTGNFSIPGYSSATFGSVTGITVNIRGAGTITLTAGSTGSLLYIGANQTVSLKDTHLKGHSTNNRALVYVDYGASNATFNMTGGTISGNTNTSSSFGGNRGGGGVYVYRGTFNMSGGTISGNTATGSGTNSGGGGVYCEGGTFNMSGTAVISDNKAANGAGVHMFLSSNTYFNMTGGTISGNIATQNGGGVGTSRVTTAQNGTIYINITGGSITGNTARLGGGIYGQNADKTIVDLLSLDLVTGNTATTAVNQLYLPSGLLLNGVKQEPRDDDEDGSDVLDYYWE